MNVEIISSKELDVFAENIRTETKQLIITDILKIKEEKLIVLNYLVNDGNCCDSNIILRLTKELKLLDKIIENINGIKKGNTK